MHMFAYAKVGACARAGVTCAVVRVMRLCVYDVYANRSCICAQFCAHEHLHTYDCLHVSPPLGCKRIHQQINELINRNA